MSDTWKLYDRETGAVVKTFDVSKMWESQRARLQNGLVMRVDFSRYGLDKGGDDGTE